jgi:hypothetical protein
LFYHDGNLTIDLKRFKHVVGDILPEYVSPFLSLNSNGLFVPERKKREDYPINIVTDGLVKMNGL